VSGQHAFSLDRLMQGSLLQLRTEAEYFSRLTNHSPELGRLNETHLVRLLRQYLPPKIGVGTGFIVSGSKTPAQSPQCDIILYDALNNAPFYTSDTWSIYPIEMVYGVIEVKTKLKRSELRDAFQKCSKIRAMSRLNFERGGNKAYLRRVNSNVGWQQYYQHLPPRFFVFGYDGWAGVGTLHRNFVELSNEYIDAHIHGVCSLGVTAGIYVRHLAYRKGPGRFECIPSDGFWHFLMRLPPILDSMLPPDRVGLGFDLVDIDHYPGVKHSGG
jgi:hypothetical protein